MLERRGRQIQGGADSRLHIFGEGILGLNGSARPMRFESFSSLRGGGEAGEHVMLRFR